MRCEVVEIAFASDLPAQPPRKPGRIAVFGSFRAEQADFRRVLNGFLRKLTRQSRTYFIRRYWYGESIREIADSCGAGEEKVKSSLFRTRQRLRAALEKEGML